MLDFKSLRHYETVQYYILYFPTCRRDHLNTLSLNTSWFSAMRVWWPLAPVAAGILEVPLVFTGPHGPAVARNENETLAPLTLWSTVSSNEMPSGWFQKPPEEVALWDYRDILYTTELRVGPLSKVLHVMIDTGSSNLWLKSELVPAAEVIDVDAHVTYGMGVVYGKEAEDRMCLAALCVGKQTFVLALKIEGMGRNSELFDGILGMAFPQMLDVGTHTFFEDLGYSGGFDNLGFGLVLRGLHQHSFLTLGEVPELIRDAEKKASTNGVTLDVHGFETRKQAELGEHGPFLFWFVALELCVRAGGDVSSTLLKLNGYGIVDSGTSLLLLPMPAYTQAMWALTFGQKVRAFHHGLVDCESQLNPLVFHFPGREGDLFLTLSTSDLLLPTLSTWHGRKVCKIGISPLEDDGETLPHMILGDVFMRKVTSIFDLNHATVTLVPQGAEDAAWKLEFLEIHRCQAWQPLMLVLLLLLMLTFQWIRFNGFVSMEENGYAQLETDC